MRKIGLAALVALGSLAGAVGAAPVERIAKGKRDSIQRRRLAVINDRGTVMKDNAIAVHNAAVDAKKAAKRAAKARRQK
jgi:hypothetical protein